VIHALLFEGGLIVMGVPLIAWWLSVSLWQAFLLDIGVLLFSCRTPTCITGAMTWCASAS
jgi:uncharacterized membrane protein